MSDLKDYSIAELYKVAKAANEQGKKNIAQVFSMEILRRTKGIVGTKEDFQQIVPKPKEMPEMADPKKYGQAYTEALARGLTLGASDYPVAIASGVKGAVTGEGFADPYKQSRQQIEGRRQQFKEASPILSLAAEVAPSMATGLGVSKVLASKGVGKAGQLLAGGAEGATAGGLTTYGDIEDKFQSAAIGAGAGVVGAGTGLLFPKVTSEAKRVSDQGIDLTVGQRRGGLPKFLEDTIEDSIIDLPVGVGARKLKVFEDFNRNIIEDAVAPIGLKFKKGMSPEDIFTKAVEKTRSAYKDAVSKVWVGATGNVKRNIKALKNKENAERFMDTHNLRKADFDRFMEEINDIVVSRIGQKKTPKIGEMTKGAKRTYTPTIGGEMFSDIMSSFTKRTGELYDEGSAGVKISDALKSFKQDFIDDIEDAALNIEGFNDVRAAWSNMSSIKEAAKKRDIITPIDYKNALEKRYGATYRNSEEYKKLAPIMNLIGEGGSVAMDESGSLRGLQTIQGARSSAKSTGNIIAALGAGGSVATGGTGIVPAAVGIGGLSAAYRFRPLESLLGGAYSLTGRLGEGTGASVGSSLGALLSDEVPRADITLDDKQQSLLGQ